MLPILAGILSSLISNNLPTVAQAVVDKGLDYVQDKIGMELKPDMTPEMIQEVKKAAMQHEEFKVSEANKNTANARDMQKEALKQDDLFSKRYVYYLSTFWSVVSTLYIFGITFLEVPLASIRYSDTILGFLLGTIIASIINYFLGSSSGSDKKTELLQKGKQNE